MSAWLYRFAAAGSCLAAFLGMSYLYAYGDRDLYQHILTGWGIVPFRSPFIDISGSLAAWECARQGIDVILSDPCDVLHRPYNYSPLWQSIAGVPLGVQDTTVVGWCLDLLFIASLPLLPPPKRPIELILVLAATVSTMVVFALERANPDVLLFLLAITAAIFAEGRLLARLLGYLIALMAALIKYYPIVLLIIAFRERTSILLAVAVAITVSLAVFWAGYHDEVLKGLPTIASGRYDTDLFAAKNLPFLAGMMVENAVRPSAFAAPAGYITTAGLYAALIGTSVAIWQKLSRLPGLRPTLASLPGLDRLLLVIGSAVIAGCFFAGQSIGYRGIFLLLVLPGLLALSRSSVRELRGLGLGTGVVVVLLMWGECFRLALHRVVDQSGISEVLASEMKIQFWLLRELCWWWTVSVMLAVLTDFLRDSPIVHNISSLFGRRSARLR